ncbi:UNVERIFIED_CONTAM: hypothetical protein PYX00_004781 [Menopon gallinae]|uniref:Uncharacterized protein n=1 Tax=Menopon gallinae TaxID=328185 RepID=A0AAW2I6D4_9NEOP
MEKDGNGDHTPLSSKNGTGELESLGILLPPLQQQPAPVTRFSPNSLRRILMTATVIAFIVIVLVVTAVAAASHMRQTDILKDDPDHFDVPAKPQEQHNADCNFEMELRRVYNKIMDKHKPEELKGIFDYLENDTSDMETVDDLRAFLASEEIILHNLDLTGKDVDTTVRLTRELHSWYTYLSDLKTNLTKYRNRATGLKLSHDFKMNLRKSRELDKLLEEWTRPMTVSKRGNLLMFKGNIILLSEVRNYLEVLSLGKRKIFIFASHILYLDSDIVIPGIDIALIAPKWSFTKLVTVFTSGLNAVQHQRRTAPPGEDGLPGKRGGDGGHFLGIGDFDGSYLRVYNDGGNGGDGQNGANGRDGTNATDTSDPYRCKIHIEDMKDKYGEVLSYYKVYDSLSCGENGTDGGAPGEGGDGGITILMDFKKDVKYDSGRRGSYGSAGKGGTAGRGAASACYFYAEMKKTKMYPATVPVCGTRAPSGFSGRDGFNSIRHHHARPQFFAYALQEYRSYAREEYSNGSREIMHFLEKLDELENVTQAEDMRTELSSIARTEDVGFYNSLNKRIDKALNHSGSSREKVLLTYLRVLSFGKMLELKRNLDNLIIVDLDVFLEKVHNDLERADFVYVDHSLPILMNLVDSKVDNLMDSLHRWTAKCKKMSENHNADLKRMAELTYFTARALEMALVGLPGDKTGITVLEKPTTPKGPKTSTTRFLRRESRLLQELNSDVVGRLKSIKRLLKSLNNLYSPESEFSSFPFEVDYLESILHLRRTVEEKKKFKMCIDDAHSMHISISVHDAGVEIVRKQIFDLLVTSQYNDAVSVFRQWVFPHMSEYEQSLPKNVTAEGARNGISLLRKWIKEYKSTITPYDKYIREAIFSWNNSVGEYYKWYNGEIRSDLAELFRGKKVVLTADVENNHIYTKNAIKFRTVRIEFQSKYDEVTLKKLLKDVQVEMKHSGYSYYYYNGQTYLQTGEEFDLHYSYELSSDNEPNNCNMVYKKLLNGPAVFSPYTSWSLQLRGVSESLIKFVDYTDIVLVGSGSYVEVVNPEPGFN